MQVETRSIEDLRAEVQEVVSGVEQVEVDPSLVKFITDKPGSNEPRPIMLEGAGDTPLRVEGEGLALFRDELNLTATTVRDLSPDEAAWVMNGRRNELDGMVVDVKNNIILGEHENLLNPVEAFDACVQGLGDCEALVGKFEARPNYLSCDLILPASVDPLEVDDPSHAACHFHTNGQTQMDLRIYRLACTNGMTVGRDVHSRYLSSDDHERRLLDTTIAAEEVAAASEVILNQYELLADFEVESADDAIAQWCRTHNIGKDIADTVRMVYHSYYEDMGSNAYAITQAFSHVTSHEVGEEVLTPGQCNRIDKMLTTVMADNAENHEHCGHCGANMVKW